MVVFEKTACIKTMYKEHASFVTFDGKLSEPFSITSGEHQDSILGPIPFNIAMEAIQQNIETRALKELLYADDSVILADSMIEAENHLNLWISTLGEYGLSVNLNKRKQ